MFSKYKYHGILRFNFIQCGILFSTIHAYFRYLFILFSAVLNSTVFSLATASFPLLSESHILAGKRTGIFRAFRTSLIVSTSSNGRKLPICSAIPLTPHKVRPKIPSSPVSEEAYHHFSEEPNSHMPAQARFSLPQQTTVLLPAFLQMEFSNKPSRFFITSTFHALLSIN